jgi:hypothetical protein
MEATDNVIRYLLSIVILREVEGKLIDFLLDFPYRVAFMVVETIVSLVTSQLDQDITLLVVEALSSLFVHWLGVHIDRHDPLDITQLKGLPKTRMLNNVGIELFHSDFLQNRLSQSLEHVFPNHFL